MKIEYSKLSDVLGEITMVVEESDYADKVKKELKEIGKKHAEPGFRPGHVPAGLIAKKYGKAVKYDEINKLVGDALFDYIRENKLEVLGNPVPDKSNAIDDDANEFTLKFKVGVAPKINVTADKEMHIPYYEIEVTEEMMDRQDAALRRRFGSQEPGEEVDDTALVKGVITQLNEDGTVTEGGVVVENGIVAPQYFKSDEQRDLFLGKHVGDVVVFNPGATCDNSETELASMLNVSKEDAVQYTGNFSFDIKEIIVLKLADLNEDFFKQVFGEEVKDEAAYREAIRKMIQASLAGDQNYRFTIDAKDVIMKAVGTLELPDEVLKEFLLAQNKELTPEKLEEEYPNIREELSWDIVKNQLGEQLKVEVTEEDVRNTSRMMARQQFAQYGMTNVPDDAVENYVDKILEDNKARNQVYQQTADMKLFGALRDAVTADTKTVTVDEFNALFTNGAEIAND